MFYEVLFFLQGLVLLQALLAYLNGFLYPGQTKRRPGRRISFYVQHPGMWGDFVYLSVVTAAVYEVNQSHWGVTGLVVSFGISAMMTAGMVFEWTQASSDMDHAFSGNNRPKACGLVHALYMFLVIPGMVQFFWFTSADSATSGLRLGVTAVLMIHIIVGVLLPERITDGAIILVSCFQPYIF
jgi:hypothetical protein